MSGWLVTLRFCSGGRHKQPADLCPHRFRKNASESLAQRACIRLLRVRVLLRREIISISIFNILYHKEGFYFIIISITVLSLHNPRVCAGGIRSDDRGIYR